ncbi:hypothetical protein GF376_01045 [Candidatus Peregrinibacteria bacterium]|nr:hypothetical protein [Candidatus Peregrinibacteria bacterium]
MLKTLHELVEYFPKREITVARELTKIYEEFVKGSPQELLEYFQNKKPKGEFVVIISAA